ncbi:MAG: class I SAM-dependent methyltransferase [Pseudomonadales bacterium]|nr:class I SAM-dependent methyltransferase [Pseudomonadales bacterium]
MSDSTVSDASGESNEHYGLPNAWFVCADETPDEDFYQSPRMVAHVDEGTLTALTEFYRSFIPQHSDVLDLMSSWISHLPAEVQLGRVVGLGMNADELAANTQLTQWSVQNLNDQPILPYASESFDRALIVVSIQYLRRPIDVLLSVHNVLREGAEIAIAMSHRLFPTKAIVAFQSLSVDDRMNLVRYYLEKAGFREIELLDCSPANADPLWIVTGKKQH